MLDQLEKDLNQLQAKSRRQVSLTTATKPKSRGPFLASPQAAGDQNSEASGFPQQVVTGSQIHAGATSAASPNSADSKDGYTMASVQQLTEEEAEVRLQKDTIYKKVSDLFALLKQGEEEAQVQMLNWENFVIQ